MVEQRARDRDGVLGDRRQRQPREAQVGERLPALRAPVSLGQIPFASHAGSFGRGLAVLAASPSLGRPRARDSRRRDRRRRQLCRSSRSRFPDGEPGGASPCARHGRDRIPRARDGRGRRCRGRAIPLRPAARRCEPARRSRQARDPPSLVSASSSLSSPNSRASASCTSRSAGAGDASGKVCANRARAVGIIRANRFQPALGFLLEAIEREIERDESGHDLPPKVPEVR